MGWKGNIMKLNNVTNMEIKFGNHVIAYKIHTSSRPYSVSYEAVDLALKLVKSNLSFDLVKL